MGKDNGIRLVVGVWLTVLALNIAVWAFIIWVVIQVMQHFGII